MIEAAPSCMTMRFRVVAPRYFMDAANASNKIAVIDTKEGKLEKLVEVGKTRTRAWRQLHRSQVRPRLGNQPPRRRNHLADRHRSEEVRTTPGRSCVPSRAWAAVRCS